MKKPKKIHMIKVYCKDHVYPVTTTCGKNVSSYMFLDVTDDQSVVTCKKCKQNKNLNLKVDI